MKEVEQQPTPLRTILQNFLNHVENLDRLSDDSYDKEFQSLKLFSESLKSIKHYACTEGEKEVNKKKNRYKDILPFDYTRVILSGIPGVQGSDYVNANFIKGASGSLAYIASQGPLPHTANDFWRMVVECEVQVIVMACNEEESGKHKCEHYWTDNEGEEKQFGIASIRLVKASVVCPDFLVRTMQLKYNKNDIPIERTVCQFHYSAWPDHGVPPLVRPLLDMVRLVRDTQASETLPVLIHCSAGCGRTGTICAIDYVWGLLRAGKLTRDFSLLKLVRDMRKQRIAMVQTKDQYVLVHKAVRELFQEQLKMIDAHPYENVDLNGVSLVQNEPLYEQLKASDVSEKQDNKEKESLKEPDRKRETAPASKQEKEVENQTQKQLASFCVVDNASSADSGTDSSVTLDKTVEIEQTPTSKSSLLQKPRIAKLKALFERSPNSKSPKNRSSPKTYDETDFHKARPSQQVTRSHSLGAVRKPSKFSQFQSASETPVALYRKLFSSDSKKTTPEVEQSQLKRVTEENGHDQKPALPVKRSKSLKVIGTSQAKSKSTLQQQLCSLLVDDVPPVASSSQVTNDRFQYCNGSGTKEYVNISELRQPTKNPLSKSQSAVQLPAQNDNDVRKPLDGGMQKIVSECRKYLMGSQDPPEPDTRQFDSLSVEAQRKINNIVGGIGIRERRNSFRKAVCHDSTDKRKDYEPIWLPDDTVHNHNGHHPGRFNAIQSPGRTIDSATHNPSRPNDDKFLSLHSNSSLSSSGTSSNSGKRLLEFEKPADQRSHLHQRALAQAMHSGVSRTPNRHPPAAMFPDPTKIDHLQYNSPAYRNVTEPYGMIQQQQHRAGPLAPPRTKRHHRNSMIETASPNKDPIYANTTQIKASKDEWHGALGVDVDSVAASMKQTPTQTESSLTRAFEKLSTKASNMRTKLSPKFEAESPSHKNMQPNPDTRQQGARPSPRVSHPVKKQQQYL